MIKDIKCHRKRKKKLRETVRDFKKKEKKRKKKNREFWQFTSGDVKRVSREGMYLLDPILSSPMSLI